MNKQPIALLLVNNSRESELAKKLCSRYLKINIRIVDQSDVPPSPELPFPELIAPEGKFTYLKGIKEYIKLYSKSSEYLTT